MAVAARRWHRGQGGEGGAGSAGDGAAAQMRLRGGDGRLRLSGWGQKRGSGVNILSVGGGARLGGWRRGRNASVCGVRGGWRRHGVCQRGGGGDGDCGARESPRARRAAPRARWPRRWRGGAARRRLGGWRRAHSGGGDGGVRRGGDRSAGGGPAVQWRRRPWRVGGAATARRVVSRSQRRCQQRGGNVL